MPLCTLEIPTGFSTDWIWVQDINQKLQLFGIYQGKPGTPFAGRPLTPVNTIANAVK